MEPAPSPFAALSRLAGKSDPTARARTLTRALDAIPHLQAWLRRARQEAVLEMRADGMSHGDVAKALGISRARAQQIAEGKTSGGRVDSDKSQGATV
jgi:DNA-directed RNA polymerase specialized sigma24 family protein